MTETSDRSAPVSTASNWVHFLFSGILLLVSMVIYQSSQAAGLRKEINQFRRENAALRQNLARSQSALQKSLDEFHEQLEQLHTELDSAHAEAGQSVAQAQAAAVRHADELISNMEKKHRQQEEQERQLTAELNQVKQSTAETSNIVSGISNVVGTMSTEVESVRSLSRQNSSGLQQTRGDLGFMSGLIATNADEIQKIREMGGRNVYEFSLKRSEGMRRIGDIQVALGRTDPKHKMFTVEILAGDLKVEKRDKTVNEPVQFYVPGKGRHVYELVVNEVSKDAVKGYLASPKVTLARNEAGITN